MRAIALLLVCTVGLGGCIRAQLRQAASEVLECPSGKITLEEKHRHTWMATGCERAAICDSARTGGGEVRCEGGGPLTP